MAPSSEPGTSWPVPRQDVHGARDGVLARAEDLAAHAALSLLVRLPAPARDACVAAVARLARRVDRRRSDAARRFLRQAFGELDPPQLERRVLDAWRHLFTVTLETAGFERHVAPERLLEHYEVELCPAAREIAAARRGAIFVTAHLGNWEAAAMLAAALGFAPFYAIAKAPRNKPLSMRLQRLRELRGVRLLPRRGAMRDAPTILAAGGTVGMLLDQRARKKPVLAPFFGRLARCDRSAGVLIKRLRAPVMVGACYRTERPWRWRAVVPVVLEPAQLAAATPEAIATRINAELEALIRAAPDQYFWLHDRFKDTPLAAEAPGDEPADHEG